MVVDITFIDKSGTIDVLTPRAPDRPTVGGITDQREHHETASKSGYESGMYHALTPKSGHEVRVAILVQRQAALSWRNETFV